MKSFSRLCACALFVILVQQSNAQQLVAGYKARVQGTPYYSITSDGQGNSLIYGNFDHIDGEYVGRLGKLSPTGTIDHGFQRVFADAPIDFVQVQSDHKILISGRFSQINGSPVKNLVRLNADGSIDKSFTSKSADVGQFALQSSGKVIAITPNWIVRLNNDGSIDETFNQIAIASAYHLALSPTDDIYYTYVGKVFKSLPNGTIDPAFTIGDGAVSGLVDAIIIQADGKIVVGGHFTSYNGTNANSLIRLHSNGQPDASFNVGVGPDGQIITGVQKANGNILIAGQFSRFNNQAANLVELKQDGTMQKVIAQVSINWITSIVETPQQEVVIGGEFTTVNGIERKWIAKFNSDYTLAGAFKPVVSYNNPNSRIVEPMENGSSVIGGTNDFKGVTENGTFVNENPIMLNPLGKYERSFKAPVAINAQYLTASLTQTDGKTVFSGNLASNPGPSLFRLLSDGSKDNSFNVGSGPTENNASSASYALRQRGDEIYVGGGFSAFNGTATNGLVSLNLDGTVKKAFPSVPAGSFVYLIDFQTDGKIILEGTFFVAGNLQRLIRLNADGTVDNSFHMGAVNGDCSFMRVDASDRIYIGGNIWSYDGALVNLMFRLLPDGNIDGSFQTGSGFGQSYLRSLELIPGNKLAVGGIFSSYNGMPHPGIVILNESGTAVSTPGISLGNLSVIEKMRYSNGALFIAGRLIQNDYQDVFGNGKITLSPQMPPAAPNDVKVDVPVNDISKIEWKDNSSNELAFIIERAEDNENNYHAIDTVWMNTTMTSDKNVIPQKKYFYRVTAINDGGVAVSESFEFIWQPVPIGQIVLSAAPLSDSELQLSWELDSQVW